MNTRRRAIWTLAGSWLAAVFLLTAPVAGAQQAAPTSTLEIFSWWTTGGEAAGLNELYRMYGAERPAVEIINSVVAGGGANAKAVLKMRMLGGDPPDSFQVHAGRELIDTWVVANKMEPLDDLFQSEGWAKVFPKDLLDIVSQDGHFWSVPVNIHRANVLWYNKQLLADNGLKPPTTFDEFFQVAEALQTKGITPLALGDNEPWAAAHLFETVLVGTLGPDGYRGLWDGNTQWTGPKVTHALETFKRVLGFLNADHAERSWDQANDLLIQGQGAMEVMGDWVDADNLNKGYSGYGWLPTPNTQGTFDVLSDSFGLPKGAKDRDNVLAWLKLLGSKEGQDTFNPLKGSIPARTDAGNGNYGEYLRYSMQEFSSNQLVPSVVHGAAAKEGWATEFVDAVNVFVTEQDVAATQNQLQQACVDAGACK